MSQNQNEILILKDQTLDNLRNFSGMAVSVDIILLTHTCTLQYNVFTPKTTLCGLY